MSFLYFIELTDTITHLLISSCGKYLVAGDPKSNIIVWTFVQNKQQWKFHCKLPKYQLPPTTMAMHPSTSELVIVYCDSKVSYGIYPSLQLILMFNP